MMWQERQNFVCLERSMSVEAAIEPHRTGSTQKATNASIFPGVATVIEGRTTMIAIRIAVITSRAYRKASGDSKFNAMSPRTSAPRPSLRAARFPRTKRSTCLLLFSEFPDIANELLDLVGQLSLIGGHFLALA